jgi:hypothetical protein
MPVRRLVGLAAALLVGLASCGCGTRAARETAAPEVVKSPPAPAHEPAAPLPEATVAARAEAAAPKPDAARGPRMAITPEHATITADDPGLQLRVSRQFPDGTESDLSSRVSWQVDPPDAAAIEPGGYLRPLQARAATVTATADGGKVAADVKILPRTDRSWDFDQDVLPVLTRLGCNTGSCHGKADGQNGFHLSLSGYDPDGDFQAIARDGGQRRVSPLAPEQSLLIQKATGRAPHGGGPRMAAGSAEYRLLLDWLAAGSPRQRGKSHGAVVRVSVEPRSFRLSEPGPGQLRVVARFADSHERDVTRQALFKTNDEVAATVDPQGRAALKARGEADLVVRYQSHVQSVRLSAVVNPDLKFDFAALPRENVIDRELFRRLEALKVPPSPPSSDAAFLRRVSLDLTGEQPTPAQIRAFLADNSPAKRAKLVDQLLERPEFVLFWRIKLGDVLQISTARQGNTAYRYQQWIDSCLVENTPWDVVVTRLLTALGDPNDREAGGPVNYALDSPDATVQAEQTAQRFLGLRMRCAQCHDHPFDVWTQDDYFGLAAFFAKVQRGGMEPGMMSNRTVVSINPAGQVTHLRTKKPAAPRLLGGKVVTVAAKDDPRQALAKWMTAPDNPYFARAMANWTWAQLFGKGLVDPPDDMSQANPAVHPELLDALQRHFVATKYDLRGLIRTIATSQAYGLSSGTVPGNERDSRLFSHHLPRPLTAHQMADALAQATDVPNAFGSLGNRLSIRVSDPSVPSQILDTFGRCTRAAGCAPVQTPPLSLKQALLLIGGDVIENKVTNLNGYLASALKLELEPDELVENLYLRTVCRPPTPEESSRWAAELKQASSYREAAEDLFWSLLNSREFAFNH